MKSTARYGTLALVLILFAVHATSAELAPRVRLERVPEGGVQPQVEVDAAGAVHLLYLKGDPTASDVMYCRRGASQRDFSQPRHVNSRPGSAIAIGTVRGAQLALGLNGRVHVVWNGSQQASSKPDGAAPMLYTRSTESGDGFEPERDLMTTTTHLDGGGSVAADSQGHVYVVWHGHKTTGPREEIDRGVFVAFSANEGRTFTPERQVNPPDTGVCGCCGLKAFAEDGGVLAIVYRSANQKGNRDTVLLWSTNYGSSFSATVLGQWHVSTCPMSTQALGANRQGLLGMWETRGQVYFTSFLPGRFGARDPVAAAGGTGNRKHPAFAVGRQNALLVAWAEGTGWEKGGSVAWECLDASGAQTASGRTDGLPVWSFAAAFPEPDGSFTLLY